MIRRATAEDAPAVGIVFVRARDEMPYLLRIPDDDRPKLGGWMVERHEVWVAEPHGEVVGFVGFNPGWVDHMYVDPRAQNAGIGTALLDHAKRLHPDGLQLWAFQQNVGAHRSTCGAASTSRSARRVRGTWGSSRTRATNGCPERPAPRVTGVRGWSER